MSQSLTHFPSKERLLAVFTGTFMKASKPEWYERTLAGPNETRRKISNVAPEEIRLRLTRSKTGITI